MPRYVMPWARMLTHLTLGALGFVSIGCATSQNVTPPRRGNAPTIEHQKSLSALDEEQALKAMNTALRRYAQLDSGHVADHSQLAATADPSQFAIAIATVDGQVWSVGDDDVAFPLQSLSKTFTLALVLEDRDDEAVLERVGMHATGLPFGSLAALEIRATPLQNPMVSAGAIATTSLVEGRNEADRWERTLRWFSACAGRELAPIDEVFESEMQGNDGSLAKAYALGSLKLLYAEPHDSVSRYLKSCSVGVNVRDLALMGATLAAGGTNPVTGERVMGRRAARGTLCAMITAGMYDDSGPWFFRIGLPAKSGVSGGVLAIAPGRLAIATYSPRLDEFGNSVRGCAVIEQLARQWDLHLLTQLLALAPDRTLRTHGKKSVPQESAP